MIQAVVEGRKTQTRRVIKIDGVNIHDNKWVQGNYHPRYGCAFINDGISETWSAQPRYHAGETVYIKEAYRFPIPLDNLSPSEIYSKYGAFQRRYLLDGVLCGENPYSLAMTDGRIRSPLMMPEWAARHFLTILAVRAERVQEITPEDCIAEGIIEECGDGLALRDRYEALWSSINPTYPFESNPWVYLHEFEYKGGK